MVDSEEQNIVLVQGIRLLSQKCPRLAKTCYWAGTSCIALEELHHRQSFDLDFHTRTALYDVRPILAEIQKQFPGRFEVVSPPDEFGSGFSGTLLLPSGAKITIEVRSNFEDVEDSELTASTTAPEIYRVTRER